MPELNNDEIQALAKAVGLEIQDPELTEVGYSLNAILEAMDRIDVDGLNAVEPLPIIIQDLETGS
jgi:Asp-tRNA(Asn)/Glu-tRNA(Gln) amidotransferase C subunit